MQNPKEKQQQETETELTIVPDKANASVEIVPFGTTDRIRLSANLVRQMIATPTRTGKVPDDNQCIKFIMLCKARHLNPFEGDAFMLGYDTQGGPQFSLITAHQVFLKRAEASKGFNGMESGVIVREKFKDTNDLNSPIIEREGDLVYDNEHLLGGWAKVYRKDREKPFYRRLKLATFNTGRSRWEKDPAGMIVKCAEADSLRTAFPTHLGGLYIQEETPPIDVPVIRRAQVPKLKDEDLSGHGAPGEPATGLIQSGDSEDIVPHETPVQISSEKKTALKRKKKEAPSNEEPVSGKTLEMRRRLRDSDYTTAQLLQVARTNDWIGPTADPPGPEDEDWPLSDARLEAMLSEDGWKVVKELLEELPR